MSLYGTGFFSDVSCAVVISLSFSIHSLLFGWKSTWCDMHQLIAYGGGHSMRKPLWERWGGWNSRVKHYKTT